MIINGIIVFYILITHSCWFCPQLSQYNLCCVIFCIYSTRFSFQTIQVIQLALLASFQFFGVLFQSYTLFVGRALRFFMMFFPSNVSIYNVLRSSVLLPDQIYISDHPDNTTCTLCIFLVYCVLQLIRYLWDACCNFSCWFCFLLSRYIIYCVIVCIYSTRFAFQTIQIIQRTLLASFSSFLRCVVNSLSVRHVLPFLLLILPFIVSIYYVLRNCLHLLDQICFLDHPDNQLTLLASFSSFLRCVVNSLSVRHVLPFLLLKLHFIVSIYYLPRNCFHLTDQICFSDHPYNTTYTLGVFFVFFAFYSYFFICGTRAAIFVCFHITCLNILFTA